MGSTMRIFLVRNGAGALRCRGARRRRFAGANGKIAFVRSGDIWTMNPRRLEPGGHHEHRCRGGFAGLVRRRQAESPTSEAHRPAIWDR